MRALVYALVFANLIALGWWTGVFDGFLDQQRQPERMGKQVDPERIQVVPIERLNAAPRSAVPPSPSFPVALADAGGSGPTKAGDDAERCLEFGPVDEARGVMLVEVLWSRLPVAAVTSHSADDSSSYLIYVPPAGDTREAQQRLAENRRLGVSQQALMPDGPYRNAISLALLRSEDAARAFAEKIQRLGVRTVRVAQRAGAAGQVKLRARSRQQGFATLAVALGGEQQVDVRDCERS